MGSFGKKKEKERKKKRVRVDQETHRAEGGAASLCFYDPIKPSSGRTHFCYLGMLVFFSPTILVPYLGK
jgi:hypothetical protein